MLSDREVGTLAEVTRAMRARDPRFVASFRSAQRGLGPSGPGVYTFAVLVCVVTTVLLLFSSASFASVFFAGAALFFARARARAGQP